MINAYPRPYRSNTVWARREKSPSERSWPLAQTVVASLIGTCMIRNRPRPHLHQCCDIHGPSFTTTGPPANECPHACLKLPHQPAIYRQLYLPGFRLYSFPLAWS
ncbi:hypothetical protein Mapa_000540 [Marchantia paleacea]|nr:hypothetical protein Mapa_000540 [Marchantia paleacea]